MLAMTSDFCGNCRNSTKIKKALADIAACGFSHVHWCHEWTGTYLYSTHEMIQIREWCEEFGLAVKGVHASAGEENCSLKDYTSSNEHNRLAGVELIKNRIDLAYILDAKAIVLHFEQPWQRFEAETEYWNSFYISALRSFDELESYCKTRRIKICIENSFNTTLEWSLRMFDTLFERYDKDYMGICFDTGHANMIAKKSGQGSGLEFAERYTDRLFMIHIHDNHGEADEHLIPFDGNFDWENFAPILARSPYAFPILMEPSISKAERTGDNNIAWLKKAFESGTRFSGYCKRDV